MIRGISPETAVAGVLSRDPDVFDSLRRSPCHMHGFGTVAFTDTSAMAREAIRKAQWRKIVSRLPAGVQDPPPGEGA